MYVYGLSEILQNLIKKKNNVFRNCLMAGSLCLPVCFIAVVYRLELIFGYQISILRMAGEGRVLGGCSSAVSRTKELFAASWCVGFFFCTPLFFLTWNFHIIKRKRLLFDIMEPLTSINNADRVSSWSWSSLGAS